MFSINELLLYFDAIIIDETSDSFEVKTSVRFPIEVYGLVSSSRQFRSAPPIETLGNIELSPMFNSFIYTFKNENMPKLIDLLFLLSENKRFKAFSADLDKEIEQNLHN